MQGNNTPRDIARAREGTRIAAGRVPYIVHYDMRMGGRWGLSWRVNAMAIEYRK